MLVSVVICIGIIGFLNLVNLCNSMQRYVVLVPLELICYDVKNVFIIARRVGLLCSDGCKTLTLVTHFLL